MAKNETSSKALKELLAHDLGGKPADWKRGQKKEYAGDVSRHFENEKLGLKVDLYERPDGLLCAERPDGSLLTARLSASGAFNAAAKPSALDQVMNHMLEGRDCDDALYAKAVKEGFVKQFSFSVCKYDTGVAEDPEALFATIYPTVRDETFKCPEYIRPLVPKADDTDECVVTEWRFPAEIDTPAKIVRHLELQGLTWDRDSQKRDPAVYKEITDALGETGPQASSRVPKAKRPDLG